MESSKLLEWFLWRVRNRDDLAVHRVAKSWTQPSDRTELRNGVGQPSSVEDSFQEKLSLIYRETSTRTKLIQRWIFLPEIRSNKKWGHESSTMEQNYENGVQWELSWMRRERKKEKTSGGWGKK